jgi:putative flippase GtrA
MTSVHTKAVRKETKRFSLVGLIATTVDYTIYNVITGVFHGPLIIGNLASTSAASIVSFVLNREVVFDGTRHTKKRYTIMLYILIIAVSIYAIQSIVLYLVHRYVPGLGGSAGDLLAAINIHGISDRLLQNNLAKVIASFTGAIWNFFMLRKFVFVPLTDNPEKHVDVD